MAGNNVHILDDSNFEAEVLQATGPVLVDFHATWCGPCKVVSPVVDKIADSFVGKLKVAKVDIDKAQNTARKYGVMSVPTLMVFEGGQKKASHSGVANEAKIKSLAGL